MSLLEETVKFGSVCDAFDAEAFSPEECLEWLSTVETTDDTQLAYFALCSYLNPEEQYLSDNRHFFVLKPEYYRYTALWPFDHELPSVKDSEESGPLSEYISGESNVFSILRFFVPGTTIEKSVAKYFKARIYFTVPGLRLNINPLLLESDWIDMLEIDDKLGTALIQRVKLLKEEAPTYYMTVKERYREVVSLLSRKYLLASLNFLELTFIDSEFPGILSRQIFSLTPLERKLAVLPLETAGYLLGLPVQKMQVSGEQINKAVKLFQQLGFESYCEKVKEFNVREHLQNCFTGDTVVFSNENDVLLEDVSSYSPFDIVPLQVGNCIFRFSRPEFQKIVDSGKNPWTNEPVTGFFLMQLVTRLKIAQVFNLPEPKPLKDLLTDLLEE